VMHGLKHHSFKYLTLLAIFSIPALVPFSAHAASGNVKKLDKKNITEFIMDTKAMTKTASGTLSEGKITSYLNKHLSDDATFVTKIIFNIPNMPQQEMVLNLEKKDFIDTAKEGAQNIKGYDNITTITDIDISFWGKSAIVKTENIETGFMPVPTDPNNREDVAMESRSSCAQTLGVDKGVIQVITAVCQTEITFQE